MSLSQSLQLSPGMRFVEKLSNPKMSLSEDMVLLITITIAGCFAGAVVFAGLALVVLMLLNGTGLLASISLIAGLMFTLALILCAGLYHVWTANSTAAV